MKKETNTNKVSNDTVTDDVIKHAMERAIELSINNAKNRTGGPFGCVIISKEGRIIAEGSNKVTEWNDPSAHAEVVTIRTACKELKTHDLSGYIIATSCFPCSMCYSTIRWSGIESKDIYYANTRDDAHNIGFSDLKLWEEVQNDITDMVHIKNENALDAFKIWDADTEKIKY
jgi:tRNA(Arg) A34 adenosine deaminase TadA